MKLTVNYRHAAHVHNRSEIVTVEKVRDSRFGGLWDAKLVGGYSMLLFGDEIRVSA